MRTIEEQLNIIKSTKRIGLMTHVVIGFPSLKETRQLVIEMEKAGADIVELQIPFSDPLADGPTIMQANDIALENGVTIDNCFSVMSELSQAVQIPLLFMGYYNVVFRRGVERFCQEAKTAGCQGLIIPDIPVDEENYEHFIEQCNTHNLHHIRLLSPTSTLERITLNASVENGFVYCTARAGITGSKNQLDPSTITYIESIKKSVSVPVAVGFGISQPEHIQALIGHADIAVVGSAIIDIIKSKGISEVSSFLSNLM